MRIRGKVKLLCEFCKKTVVRLNRDQHYVYVYCTKNPRHKQRSKFVTFTTQAGAHGQAGTSGGLAHAHALQLQSHACDHHHHHGEGHECEHEYGIPCLPEPPLAIMTQHMHAATGRGLLGSRHTSVLGESFWRSTAQRWQDS